MVFQEDRLLPGCTVLENLRLVAPERPDTELIALLGELGLSGWENGPPQETLGRNAPPGSHCPALVFHSPLVIMDEPFKGLDEATLAATLACVDRWLGDRTFLAGDPQSPGGGTPGLPDHPSGRAHPNRL